MRRVFCWSSAVVQHEERTELAVNPLANLVVWKKQYSERIKSDVLRARPSK